MTNSIYFFCGCVGRHYYGAEPEHVLKEPRVVEYKLSRFGRRQGQEHVDVRQSH